MLPVHNVILDKNPLRDPGYKDQSEIERTQKYRGFCINCFVFTGWQNFWKAEKVGTGTAVPG